MFHTSHKYYSLNIFGQVEQFGLFNQDLHFTSPVSRMCYVLPKKKRKEIRLCATHHQRHVSLIGSGCVMYYSLCLEIGYLDDFQMKQKGWEKTTLPLTNYSDGSCSVVIFLIYWLSVLVETKIERNLNIFYQKRQGRGVKVKPP